MTLGPWRKYSSIAAAGATVDQFQAVTGNALASDSSVNSDWVDLWGNAAGLNAPAAAVGGQMPGGWIWGTVNKPAAGAELVHIILRVMGADNESSFNTQPMEVHTQLLNRTSWAFNDNSPNFGKGVSWGPIWCPTRFARVEISNADHAAQTIDIHSYASMLPLGDADGLMRHASRSAGFGRNGTLGVGATDNGPIWCIDPHWDWDAEQSNIAALGGSQLVQHIPYARALTWAADITGNAVGDAMTVELRYGFDCSVNPLPYIAEQYTLAATVTDRANSEDLTRWAAVAGTAHFPSQVEGPFVQVVCENTGVTILDPCIRSFRLHSHT